MDFREILFYLRGMNERMNDTHSGFFILDAQGVSYGYISGFSSPNFEARKKFKLRATL